MTFDDFWDRFPNKHGGKRDAEKAWKQVKGHPAIMAALETDRPTMHPRLLAGTWLRREDFADRAVQKAAIPRARQGRNAWIVLVNAVWDAGTRFHRNWARDSLVSAIWEGRELRVVVRTECYGHLEPHRDTFGSVLGGLVAGATLRLEGE